MSDALPNNNPLDNPGGRSYILTMKTIMYLFLMGVGAILSLTGCDTGAGQLGDECEVDSCDHELACVVMDSSSWQPVCASECLPGDVGQACADGQGVCEKHNVAYLPNAAASEWMIVCVRR